MLVTFGNMNASENREKQEATATSYLRAHVWNFSASRSIGIEKRGKKGVRLDWVSYLLPIGAGANKYR